MNIINATDPNLVLICHLAFFLSLVFLYKNFAGTSGRTKRINVRTPQKTTISICIVNPCKKSIFLINLAENQVVDKVEHHPD